MPAERQSVKRCYHDTLVMETNTFVWQVVDSHALTSLSGTNLQKIRKDTAPCVCSRPRPVLCVHVSLTCHFVREGFCR